MITVVVVIAALTIGVYRSMTRLSRELETMFYDGVYLEKDKYTQPGIDSQIKKYSNAALGLATILNNYPVLTDRAEYALSLRQDLLNAVSIRDKSLAFRALSHHVSGLAQAIQNAGLTPRDTEAVMQYFDTINGAETFIKNAAYDQIVSTRWNEQSSFARLICMLIPVKEPDLF